MSIPALDRGLILLDALLSSNSPLKYTDLKNSIIGISDSSLNRLISSLIESNYICKDSENRYIPSGRLLRWGEMMAGRQNLTSRIRNSVENIVQKSKESAAFATFTGDRIEVSCSISEENSISIISKGQILHYEDDHAGSLAILGNMSKENREKCLKSEFSRISNQIILNDGLKKITYDEVGLTYYMDESREREGISRLAIPLIIDNNPCALFICAPTVRIKNHLPEFLSILNQSDFSK